MITTWDKFLPYIMPHLTGCPTDLVEQALIERTQHFCERTQLWRVDMDPETTVAGEHTYTLYLPAAVEAVLWLRLDGNDLTIADDRDMLPELFSATGQPRYYSLEGDSAVRLYPVPDAAYPFTARVVLKPSQSSRGVEQFLFDAHVRTLASGTLAQLMAMPEKTWSNLPLAAVHDQQFERGIARARVRDFRNVPLRVKPQYF